MFTFTIPIHTALEILANEIRQEKETKVIQIGKKEIKISLSAEDIFFFNVLLFCSCHVACGILVTQPGIELRPPALKVWSLNCWTAKEIPR